MGFLAKRAYRKDGSPTISIRVKACEWWVTRSCEMREMACQQRGEAAFGEPRWLEISGSKRQIREAELVKFSEALALFRQVDRLSAIDERISGFEV